MLVKECHWLIRGKGKFTIQGYIWDSHNPKERLIKETGRQNTNRCDFENSRSTPQGTYRSWKEEWNFEKLLNMFLYRTYILKANKNKSVMTITVVLWYWEVIGELLEIVHKNISFHFISRWASLVESVWLLVQLLAQVSSFLQNLCLPMLKLWVPV